MKTKIVGILVCMLLIATMILPVTGTIKSNESMNDETSTNLTVESIVVTLNAEDYVINELDTEYSEITMMNFGSILSPGEPMLPAKTFFVGLPPGSEVISVDLISETLGEIPGKYHIRPAPPFYGDETTEVNWEINTKAYTSADPYPSNVYEYMGMSQLRKYYLAMISYAPFTYYPSDDKLVLHKSITLRVNYKIVEDVPDELLADMVMDDIASEIIVNYPSLAESYHPSSLPTNLQPYDYIIITTPSLVSSLSSFQTWKQNIGFKVNIVTTSWISSTYSGNDLQQEIRNFLRTNYVSWGIKYVLIVGSHNTIPMRVCCPDDNNFATDGRRRVPTDYYYADLSNPDSTSWDSDSDGLYGERNQDNYDYTPEVYVGRIPIDTAGTVTNICSKIQSFEQAPNSGWKKNAMLLGCVLNYNNEDSSGFARTDGAELMEQCRTNLLSGYSITTMYEKAGLAPCTYSCTFPLTNANVKTQWGSTTGWGIINWNGHGSATTVGRKVWANDGGASPGVPESSEMSWPNMIVNTDNTALNNNKPPVVFAVSCNNAYGGAVNNLGAALLSNGASAFIGSTVISWGSVGWTQPSQGGSASMCYDFTNNLANLGQDCGTGLYNAKLYYWNNFNWGTWGWRVNANMYDFNLYGDPSMKMAKATTTNNPPNTPSTPTGTTAGNTGTSYTYSTSATDPDADNVKYGWDWDGDSTVDEWTSFQSSGTTVNTPHIFGLPGTYNVKVKAEDSNGAQSSFSSALTVVISGANNPPNTPSTPTGTTAGNTGTSYTYSTSATDPDADNVKYGWDWDGDSTVDEWTSFQSSGTTVNTPHIFGLPGTYNVKVKAEDSNGAQSSFSPALTVVISGTNNPPVAPARPDGPTHGHPGSGHVYTFSTYTTDPDGDKVKYGWDWDGDYTIDEWDDNGGSYYPSGTIVSRTHSWAMAGMYNIFVKAEDTKGAQNIWFSPPLTIVIFHNNPPNKPSRPDGPTSGKSGTEYTYTSSATDIELNQLEYLFDWGDGADSGWLGPFNSGQTVSASHTWTQEGSYQIKVKARDTNLDESDWSDPLPISMPKNKAINNPFLLFLERLIERFPILEQILLQLGLQ